MLLLIMWCLNWCLLYVSVECKNKDGSFSFFLYFPYFFYLLILPQSINQCCVSKDMHSKIYERGECSSYYQWMLHPVFLFSVFIVLFWPITSTVRMNAECSGEEHHSPKFDQIPIVGETLHSVQTMTGQTQTVVDNKAQRNRSANIVWV